MNPKETLLSAFSNSFSYKIFSFIAFFVSSTLVFRYFGPEMRGEIAILLAPILILQVGLFDSGTKVQDLMSKDKRNNTDINFSSLWISYLLKLLSCMLLASILYFFGADIATYYGLETKKEIYRLCSFLLILTFLNGPIDLNVLQATRKFSQVKYFGIIESCAPLLAILSTILIDGSVVTYIYLYIVAKLALLPFTWFLLLNSSYFNYIGKITFSNIKSIITFTTPLWISSFFAFGSSQFVLLLSGLFFDFATIGIMSLAIGVTLMSISLLSVFDGFALPKINENSRLTTNAQRSRINYLLRYWHLLFSLSVLFSLFIFIFSDYIVLIIGGEEYKEASSIIKWLTILISLQPFSVLRTIIYTSQSTKKILYYSSIKFILELILLYVFFALLGPMGLSFGLSIAFIFFGYLLSVNLESADNKFKKILRKILTSHLLVACGLVCLTILSLQFSVGIFLAIISFVIFSFYLAPKRDKFQKILNT